MTKSPWNKGKAVGQKKPLTTAQIKFLQKHLKEQGKIRELALFSLQIDTMLRSSDLIKLKVNDIVDFKGEIREEINIQQKKTTQPHIVVISKKTAKILAKYIKEEEKKLDDWLFKSYSNRNQRNHISYVSHWNLVKGWCKVLGVDARDYATHTGRRTMATIVFNDTKDPKLVMNLLGQKDLGSTTSYIGTDKKESRNVYKKKYLK